MPVARTLEFAKMHGLGNDFVVIDGLSRPEPLSPAQARFLAHRRRGVGCDQVLLAVPPERPEAQVGYRIFNGDGSEAEHCGNGVRCLVRFLLDRGLVEGDAITVETRGRLTTVRPLDDGQLEVDMGAPELDPPAIPFQAPARAVTYPLEVDGEQLEIGALSMGNPHAVTLVEDLDGAPVTRLGPLIEHHPRFPRRVNAGFAQVLDPAHLRLRVWERGAGETEACGTGACAAVVAGRLRGLLGPRVAVDLPGGVLVINWAGDAAPVRMTGPAVSVFRGEIALPGEGDCDA